MIIAATTPSQWATIASLAHEIWTEHYTPIIGPEQVTYMLANFQSEPAIAAQVQEQNYHYYLLQPESQPIGYLSIQLRPPAVFLSKLYLLASERGKGYAKSALKFIESFAAEHDCKTITLTVNKYNTHTLKAYQKMGFAIQKAIVQDIGNGYIMDDYVMEKNLP